MHIGRGEKAAKTECIFVPPPGFLGRNGIRADTENEEHTIAVKIRSEPHENTCKREERKYNNFIMIDPINVANGFVSFCPYFKYLGSWVSFSLCDNFDVHKRIAAAKASMGALNEAWKDERLNKFSKYLLFKVIPCNLLLWGCKSWAVCKFLLNVLETFLHRSIR